MSVTDHLIQEEEDKLTVLQTKDREQHSQALAIMGYFSHISIHWRINTAEHKKSRGVVVCIHDKFLTQVVKMSAR